MHCDDIIKEYCVYGNIFCFYGFTWLSGYGQNNEGQSLFGNGFIKKKKVEVRTLTKKLSEHETVAV